MPAARELFIQLKHHYNGSKYINDITSNKNIIEPILDKYAHIKESFSNDNNYMDFIENLSKYIIKEHTSSEIHHIMCSLGNVELMHKWDDIIPMSEDISKVLNSDFGNI